MPDATRLGRQRALPRDERQLHPQELVELEPPRGRARLGDGLRSVYASVGDATVDEIVVVAYRRGERLGEPA